MKTAALTLAALSASALSLIAAPVIAQDLAAPSGAYKLDPTHASITWQVKHMGLSNYTARFTKFDIELNLDVETPANSTVTATVDPTSVRTDYPLADQKDFDAEVAGEKFLKAGEFPQITFTSTAVEVTGDTTATITGDLTMSGVTQTVTLDAVLNGSLASHPFAKVPAVGFSATGVLDRTAFGVEFLAPQIVAPEVSFMIEAEFVKAE